MNQFKALFCFIALIIISHNLSAQFAPFTLKIKQKTKVDKVKIQFLKVIEESRCPTGMHCLVAGSVSLLFRVNGKIETLTTKNDGLVIQANNKTYRIQIKEVVPHPKANTDSDYAKYLVTLALAEI